jgi:hypothetical protein
VSARADTSHVGLHTASLAGVDIAGNTATNACSYNILAATLKPAPALAWLFGPKRRFSTVKQLLVTSVALGASVQVTCHGKGCPFASRTPKITPTLKCANKRCTKKKPTGGRRPI